MLPPLRIGVIRRVAVLTLVMIFLTIQFLPVAEAQEASEEPALTSFTAVGQPKGYFDITLKPGQSQTVTATATNESTVPSALVTYASDAHSLVNGGFASLTRGAGKDDLKQYLSNPDDNLRVSSWLTYKQETFTLAASQSVQRTLAVSVPKDTQPGQYMASIVLENDKATGKKDAAMKQIVRRLIPVSITVPGELNPKFSYGSASHRFKGKQSVVSVQVLNTGNSNIKPAGTMVIKDSSGNTVSKPEVDMQSVYAGRKTPAEVILATGLKPGNYTADIEFTDSSSKVASTGKDIPFTVEDGTQESTQVEDPGAAVVQSAQEGGWALYAGIGVLAILVLVGFLIWRKRKKRADVQEKDTQEPIEDKYFV